MGPVISVNRPDLPNESPVQEGTRAGSVGRTLPGIAVKIVDPDTLEPKPIGEEGHLLVKRTQHVDPDIGRIPNAPPKPFATATT